MTELDTVHFCYKTNRQEQRKIAIDIFKSLHPLLHEKLLTQQFTRRVKYYMSVCGMKPCCATERAADEFAI